MGDLDVIFALVVGVLAGVAVIGALVFAITWEVCAIRRVLERHRRPTPEEAFWSSQQAVAVPERRR